MAKRYFIWAVTLLMAIAANGTENSDVRQAMTLATRLLPQLAAKVEFCTIEAETSRMFFSNFTVYILSSDNLTFCEKTHPHHDKQRIFLSPLSVASLSYVIFRGCVSTFFYFDNYYWKSPLEVFVLKANTHNHIKIMQIGQICTFFHLHDVYLLKNV